MKRKKFSTEQIVAVLKQAELGLPVAKPIRQVEITYCIGCPDPLRLHHIDCDKLLWRVSHYLSVRKAGHATLLGMRIAFQTSRCSSAVSRLSPNRASADSTIHRLSAYFGRAETIIKQRERIKRKTIEHRRLQHRKLAA